MAGFWNTRCITAALATCLLAQPGSALSIQIFEVPDGNAFPISGVTASSAPAASGTGTLSSVMRAAADYWEDVFLDLGTLNINFGWAGLSGSALATATQFVSPRDFSGVGRVGDIRFDSDGSSPWYLDDDPFTAEAYGSYSETSADLGGGEMTTSRAFGAPTGPASGRFDLFSTALHEIGHLLGLADLNDAAFDTGTLAITSGPFDGAVLDLTSTGGGHLDGSAYPLSLMDPTTNGLRHLASDVDIAAIAAFSGFSQVDYSAANLTSPPVVPLPATGLLLIGAFGAMGVAFGARRKAA